jgi:hypothetical protein
MLAKGSKGEIQESDLWSLAPYDEASRVGLRLESRLAKRRWPWVAVLETAGFEYFLAASGRMVW